MAWIEAGTCLERIRDGELYEALGYETFEDFVREEVDQAMRTIQQWIQASQIRARIAATGVRRLPSTARVCAELSPVSEKPTLLKSVWKQVLDGDGPDASSKVVRSVVRAALPKKEKVSKVKLEPEPEPEPAVTSIAGSPWDDEGTGLSEKEMVEESARQKFPKGLAGYDFELKESVANAIAGRAPMEELMRDVQSLRRKIKDLPKNKNEIAAYLTLQSVDAALANAWSIIRGAIPWVPCGFCLQEGCEACSPGRGEQQGKSLGWLNRERYESNKKNLKNLKGGDGA